MDEDAGEEEMEWLMEELEAPPTSSSSQRGRSHLGNGHITTKPVNADGLRSFTLDDQEDDSEDEVLSVPGVRVVKPPGASRNAAAHRSVFLQVSSASCVRGPLGGGFRCGSPSIGLSLGLRRRATRTSSASWRSRTGRRRAANSVCPPSPTATARQPTGNGRTTTAMRTSSGCDVTPPSLSSPSNPNSFSECLRQSSNDDTVKKNSSSFLGFFLFCFLFGRLHLYLR